ncbi:MAG: CBS domain-containing protein [Gemmatimonadota bacterium]|nr:CBS domain-containing protein [Gemmatimonadota bacterium]
MSVVALAAENSLGEVREWLASHGRGATHQGFPVIEENGDLIGIVTRRGLLDDETHPDTLVSEIVKRGPVVIYTDNTLREAADQMIVENVGRLAVVARGNPRRITGIITRSDLLHAHQRRLDAMHVVERSISFARRSENSSA